MCRDERNIVLGKKNRDAFLIIIYLFPGSENGRASAESDEEGGGAAGSGEGHDVSDGVVGGVGNAAPSPSRSLENGQNSTSGTGGNKARRRRTAFTSEQLLELEREFHAKKYLSLTERSHIAHALKLSEVQVSAEIRVIIDGLYS